MIKALPRTASAREEKDSEHGSAHVSKVCLQEVRQRCVNIQKEWTFGIEEMRSKGCPTHMAETCMFHVKHALSERTGISSS